MGERCCWPLAPVLQWHLIPILNEPAQQLSTLNAPPPNRNERHMVCALPYVLQLTPLPNVTVYYTGYRLYSHYRALQVNSTCSTSFSRCATA